MRRWKYYSTVIALLLLWNTPSGYSMTPPYELPTGQPELAESTDIGACADDPTSDTHGVNAGLVGKPVNLLSGTETFTRTDISIGHIFPISIRRRYDSRSGYDSSVGYGWAINYDRRLYGYPDGSITLRKECGWKRRFTLSGGSYVTPPGETGTLVRNADNSFTYAYKDGSRDNYDIKGRLMSRFDAQGNSMVIFYALDVRSPLWGVLPANINQTPSSIVAYDYRLSRIEERDASGAYTGNFLIFNHDPSTGRVTEITDNAGRQVTYSHDTFGNLTNVSGPNGNQTYGYSDTTFKHKMTSINDGQGEYVNTYDAKGRVQRQTHGTGTIDIEYLEPFKRTKTTTTIRDGSGNVLNIRTRTTEFGDTGQPSKFTDHYGNITTYIRDSNANILAEVHADIATGVTVTAAYTYDAHENILTETYAQGTTSEKTITYTYHSVFNSVLTRTMQSVVNPALVSVVTNFYDDSNGNLLTRTETGYLGEGTPYSYMTTYTYDANGKLHTIDGPRTDVSDVTTYNYDLSTGNLLSITQPLVGTTTYSNHDDLGNPRTVTDPNNNSTTYTYDANGRVATVKFPGDTNPTQYFYVSGGCSSCGGANKIDHITLPEGHSIWYTYDSMGNLASISDSLNNSINYTYDSEGNKLTEQIKDSSGSLQKSLNYSYDALNKLKRITNPDSSYTEYTYDFRGNRKSARNPNANTTNYTYDALGRLAAVNQPGSVDTAYVYNSNNNLTSVQDDNNATTQYKYDDKGRVYQTSSPDTGTTTYQYDPAGNLTSKTDAKGVTISYQYDAANRLTKIDFPSDTDVIYSYDSCVNGKGRLCSMTDASGTTVYEYTPKGQVKKETKTIDSVQYVTLYTYDQNGNLKTMTYPSGRVITYNYINNGKAVSVLNNAANLATNITYKPFGGLSSFTYGNGVTGSISYDNQYRVTGINAGAVMNLNYDQYDANANIQHITNTLDPTKNKTFAYDALNRVTSATGSWGSLSWTYDGVGNRQTENATSYTYQANTNKLNSVGGVSYGFDNDGNMIAEGARQYTYNQNQRLIQVVDGAMSAGYTYNGKGQRVKKVVNGVTTIFHYNSKGLLIAESDGTGATIAEYVYLKSRPLAKIEGSNVYYYAIDHLSTPQKLADSTGAVVWSADYKPFGEVTIDPASTVTNNIRFPGQYHDTETGLYQNGFRDYSPLRGGYIEKDGIGLRGGVNLYAYVANNPIKRKDPRGLDPVYYIDPFTGEAHPIGGDPVPPDYPRNVPDNPPPGHMPHLLCEILVDVGCDLVCEAAVTVATGGTCSIPAAPVCHVVCAGVAFGTCAGTAE